MGKNKFITTVVAVVGVAILYALFRFNYGPYSGSYNMYLIGNMMGLFWIPMLTVALLFRADPASLGLASCSSRRVWVGVVLLFAGLLVLMVFAAPKQAFQDYYPIFRRFSEFQPYGDMRAAFANYPTANPFIAAPWVMLYAEMSYGMYLFCWEFFFRGYLLFGLQKSLGSVAAVLLQAIAFGLLHWGKPEMIPSFAGGIILGILALNAKSFVPAFVLHWAASISFDFFVVAMRH